MQAIQDDRGHLVILDPGEEVMATLTQYLVDHGIVAGSLTGIGAVRDTTLGLYDVETHTYLKKRIEPSCELLSFMGNIATVDGAPFIHAHVVLGQRDFSCVGGHCFSSTVSVTGEFCIQPNGFTPKRFAASGFALKTIDLSKS